MGSKQTGNASTNIENPSNGRFRIQKCRFNRKLAPVSHNPHILLLIESSSAYGRGCLCGFARYARNHTNWILQHVPNANTSTDELALLKRFRADGIIARIESPEVARAIAARKVPTVAIASSTASHHFPSITTDDRQVVKIGVEHLLANGLTNLAYCGLPGRAFSDARQSAFDQTPLPPQITRHTFDHPSTGSAKDLTLLSAWLTSLPKPVGILACHDSRARQILQACILAGLEVPNTVAVVGVDNDEVICELANPPLTSIVPNVEAIGVRAASLLHEIMTSGSGNKTPILIPPLGVEVRTSSDIVALGDPVLANAVKFVRDHAGRGTTVKEILAHLRVSRSTLERRFLKQLGCTPHDYIAGQQIQRLKRLLIETTYPVNELTKMMGFRSSAHMIAVFKAATGATPGQFRRNVV
jgi:LacI family transcriptional regulator